MFPIPCISAASVARPLAWEPPPVNTSEPTLSSSGDINNPIPGDTFSTSTGGWTNSPTGYSYQWYYFVLGTPIAGATESSYTVQSADLSQQLYCKVTAFTSGGSASVDSSLSPGIGSGSPINIAPPSIASNGDINNPLPGDLLNVTTGSWEFNPTSIAEEWFSGGTDTGQSGTSYVVQSGDVGNQIYCQELATNSAGSGSSNSNSTGTVQSGAPINTVVPNISDDSGGGGSVDGPQPGDTMGVDNGVWLSGEFAPTGYAYQWMNGGDNEPLGSTTNSYTIQGTDGAGPFYCIVTASNGSGSTQVNSQTAG